MTRVRRLGHGLRLCPKCARADHGTCPACRRHRLLSAGPDGRLLCRVCREKGEIPCPSCGKPMPAGRGKVCETCYWTDTCRKRIRLDRAAFSTAGMEKDFGEFGEWLIGDKGPHKAALTVHRYLSFFLEIEREWKNVPPYRELLAHFGAEGLRRARIPMRWLREAKGVKVDAAAREEDSERRRIEGIVGTFGQGTEAHRILVDYAGKLMQRVEEGKTSLRSVRLALTPAAALLRRAAQKGGGLPDQTLLDRYLLDAPGQKAAATGFANFLRKTRSLKLSVRTDAKKAKEAQRRTLKKKIVAMARHPEEGEDFIRRWIAAGLEYFHSVKFNRKALEAVSAKVDEGGLRVVAGGRTYWLPNWRE
ncbi:hypothetical protein [Methylacidimicrobium tartarophylax]|uniref:hypothetical protein n=1 Tax=Methylacidimicrobium tartarophylax TaxID=1041768 RepID=UPI0011587D7F|nr:hypothetical protein [Methylacidimicrobium tartarophylax]